MVGGSGAQEQDDGRHARSEDGGAAMMVAKELLRSHRRRAALFIGVGAINTVLDIAAFACFYQLLGIAIIPANIMAFLIAVTNSYALNFLITFADRRSGPPTFAGFVRFLLVALMALGASTTVVYFVAMVVHPLLAKLVATAASTLVNYVGCHRFVFSGSGIPASAPSE
jgi:putative flippase GtrA